MTSRQLCMAILLGVMAGIAPAAAQDRGAAPPATAAPAAPARGARPPNPTRDPHTPGYVVAKELPDGAVAPVNEEGNFIIGPTHNPAPEMTVREDVPHGTVYNFEMKSTDSKIYPGIARDPNAPNQPDPNNPFRMLV